MPLSNTFFEKKFQIGGHFCSILLILVASSLGKPQQFGLGENYLSGNFHRLENVDFDNFEFMPEFDFDGFFQKLDAPATTQRAQERGKFFFQKTPIFLNRFDVFLFFQLTNLNTFQADPEQEVKMIITLAPAIQHFTSK